MSIWIECDVKINQLCLQTGKWNMFMMYINFIFNFVGARLKKTTRVNNGDRNLEVTGSQYSI